MLSFSPCLGAQWFSNLSWGPRAPDMVSLIGHTSSLADSTNELMSSIGCVNEGDIQNMLWLGRFENSDRPILIFFYTDTDYLYVYVPDMQNRYLFTVIKYITE